MIFCTAAELTKRAGSVTSISGDVIVHSFASVTVTKYFPAVRLLAVAVLAIVVVEPFLNHL